MWEALQDVCVEAKLEVNFMCWTNLLPKTVFAVNSPKYFDIPTQTEALNSLY